MKDLEFQWYQHWFESFVDSYCNGNSHEQEAILLKKKHSFRVLQEAQNLVSSLAITDSKLYHLTSLAAIFHDIGRFPQYHTYKTFNDKISANHGLLGYKVLRRQNVFGQLPQAEKKDVLLCVLMHNRAQIPSGLPSRLHFLLQVVRDADKLDIIPVVLPHFQQVDSEDNVVTLGLPHEPQQYSSEVIEQVRQRTMVDYRTMHWLNDFVLLMCSWVYDLNFPYTCAAVLERGYVDALVGCLPQTDEITSLGHQLRADLMRR
jgi:hypothetical protein